MAPAAFTSTGVAQLSMLVGIPALFLANATLATELPELVFLVAILLYFIFSQKFDRLRCPEGAYHHLVDSVSSLPLSRFLMLIVLGILLTAAVVCGLPQVGFALSSAIAYFTLNAIGKARQKKPKACQSLSAKVAPPTMTVPARTHAATSAAPWRQGARPATTPDVQARKVDIGDRVKSLVGLDTWKPRPLKVGEEGTILQDMGSGKYGIQWDGLTGSLYRGQFELIQKAARPEPMTGVDAEVHDLLRAGLPTAADDAVVRQIVNHVRKSILPLVPEAEVVGCASGNLMHIGNQGEKPEVDIMVLASPEVLTERLKAYYLKGSTTGHRNQKSMATLLPDVLQKTATRVLSERLTSLRFWRSQFTGPEPKIVLLAPAALGFCQHPIRINFSVNNPYPQRQLMILSKGNARCKELVLLVTRWATLRGISNTGKGHLHSYAYSLLVVYFLRRSSEGDSAKKSLLELFGDFARFYDDWFNSSASKVVAVRFSTREEQPLSPEAALFGIPFIEDPFAASSDVASTMTADGVIRLKEELARAVSIVDAGPTTLTGLLERWMPPQGVAEG